MAKLTNNQLNETVNVTCYGKTKKYIRRKAIEFFLNGMMSCDPDSSEYDRYETIHRRLLNGEIEINDE